MPTSIERLATQITGWASSTAMGSTQGRSVQEMVREATRIHAPYTHVPFHQRLDGGDVRHLAGGQINQAGVEQPLAFAIAKGLVLILPAGILRILPAARDEEVERGKLVLEGGAGRLVVEQDVVARQRPG